MLGYPFSSSPLIFLLIWVYKEEIRSSLIDFYASQSRDLPFWDSRVFFIAVLTRFVFFFKKQILCPTVFYLLIFHLCILASLTNYLCLELDKLETNSSFLKKEKGGKYMSVSLKDKTHWSFFLLLPKTSLSWLQTVFWSSILFFFFQNIFNHRSIVESLSCVDLLHTF